MIDFLVNNKKKKKLLGVRTSSVNTGKNNSLVLVKIRIEM